MKTRKLLSRVSFIVGIGMLFYILLSAAFANAATVIISWSPNQEPDIAGYKLFYGTGPGTYADSMFVPSSNSTSITQAVSGLDVGETYYFAVKAVDNAGQESGYSEETIITPSHLLHSPDSDGDGVPDEVEVQNGTDPNDPDDYPFLHFKIEAEEADIIDGNVYVLPDDLASEGLYAGTVDASGGGIETYFDIYRQGTYGVWVRTKAESGSQDTYWRQLDNGSFIRWDAPIAVGWQWNLLETVDLGRGSHDIRLNFAEKDMGTDRMFITNNQDFTPADTVNLEIEAELAPVIDGNVAIFADSAVSGGYYVGTPTDASGGGIKIDFSLLDGKICNVWALVKAESGSQDTFWWQIDGSGSFVRWNAPIVIGWQWKLLVQEYPFSDNSHELRLNFAEKNMAVDKFIITENLDFIPELEVEEIALELEAEDAQVFNSPAQAIVDATASSGYYAGNNPGESGGGIELSFNSPADGVCNIWRLAIALDGGSDTTWVNINSSGWSRKDIPIGPEWSWELLGQYAISAGVNLIQMNFSEDGMRVDAFYVASDLEFTP